MAGMGFDPADEWWGGDLVPLDDDAPSEARTPAPAPVRVHPQRSAASAGASAEVPSEAWALPLLATAPLGVVRLAVACSPRCPSHVLATLAADADPWVRAAVAAHPGCPMSVQVQLTSDPDPEVRQVARSGAA